MVGHINVPLSTMVWDIRRSIRSVGKSYGKQEVLLYFLYNSTSRKYIINKMSVIVKTSGLGRYLSKDYEIYYEYGAQVDPHEH